MSLDATLGTSFPSPSSPITWRNAPHPIFAGTEVWNVVELRARILNHITDFKDLASLIRVERRGMAMIAEKLYHTVSYEKARSRMSVSDARQQMYRAAISVILAHKITLTPLEIQQLYLVGTFPSPPEHASTSHSEPETPEAQSDLESKGGSDPGDTVEGRISTWLQTYHAELLPILLPPLRRDCPNVEKVIFGAEYDHWSHRASWMVELDRRESPTLQSNPGSDGTAVATGDDMGSGRIQHVQTFEYSTFDPPSLPSMPAFIESVNSARAPSAAFSMSNRFDLYFSTLRSEVGPLETHDPWLQVLRDEPIFANLYRAVDFGDLPIPLTTITSLVQRQAAAGYTDRLEYIVARYIPTFSLADLQAFAETAGAALRVLVLARQRGTYWSYSSVAPADLEAIVGLVRESMPKLQRLDIRMDNMGQAEDLLRQKLEPRMLLSRGSITNLKIFTTGERDSVPFNVLRYLSRILANDARVNLMGMGVYTSPMGLTDILLYLRNHPRLETINFALIGVVARDDLLDLRYDDTGEPHHVLVTQVGICLNLHSKAGQPNPEWARTLLPAQRRLQKATQQILQMDKGQSEGAAGWADEERRLCLLEQIQVQLEAIGVMRAAEGSWSEIAVERMEKIVQGSKAVIDGLRRQSLAEEGVAVDKAVA